MRAMGPSFDRALQIGGFGVEGVPGLFADSGQELHDGVAEHQREPVAA